VTALQSQHVLAWLDALQRTYADNRQHLTDLDAAIGDADHGVNMERGFNAVHAELAGAVPPDISTALKNTAMVLLRTVGGASGPLYGTFFLRASAVCAGKPELTPADVLALFEAGLAGVLQRGKAAVGDKTMVDALSPAVEAMRAALADGVGLKEMLDQAAAGAEVGMRSTIPLQARKGRASYLGERSIGHQDPGATSAYLMLRAAAELWTNVIL
jgi:phosphoenolpyruvate---glycerone phosphotransferase subunit DhaL